MANTKPAKKTTAKKATAKKTAPKAKPTSPEGRLPRQQEMD